MSQIRLRSYVSSLIFACLAMVSCTGGEQYGKLLDRRWRNIFGLESRDGQYRWFGYPVDNFGIATFYDPPADRDWTDSDRICATWSCLSISNPGNLTSEQRLEVAGFADVGSGGGVTLDETSKNHVALNLLLPGLAKLVNLSGGIDWSKGITTTLSIGGAYKRSVNRDKLRQFIEQTTTNQTLKQAYANGRLAYIAADIVARDMDVTLRVDKKLNANADAKLTQIAGTVFPKDSELKVTIDPSTSGTYHIVSRAPVVLAVQTRKQPTGGTLAANNSLGPVISVPLPAPHLK